MLRVLRIWDSACWSVVGERERGYARGTSKGAMETGEEGRFGMQSGVVRRLRLDREIADTGFARIRKEMMAKLPVKWLVRLWDLDIVMRRVRAKSWRHKVFVGP